MVTVILLFKEDSIRNLRMHHNDSIPKQEAMHKEIGDGIFSEKKNDCECNIISPAHKRWSLYSMICSFEGAIWSHIKQLGISAAQPLWVHTFTRIHRASELKKHGGDLKENVGAVNTAFFEGDAITSEVFNIDFVVAADFEWGDVVKIGFLLGHHQDTIVCSV
ncbi:hypothetical protein MA16_Dca028681 [Dendrobium catenatum]|uniref:Uncharacterized protein n=1 Tax=Dendrobium catenatum TaxID=906689 RepID=A0A2I0VEF7_9ASPA|nr:hypothetical protein MA16_Dca028681 [Dendrobium catenatum]